MYQFELEERKGRSISAFERANQEQLEREAFERSKQKGSEEEIRGQVEQESNCKRKICAHRICIIYFGDLFHFQTNEIDTSTCFGVCKW
jgi:hypothetical protein